MSDEYTLKVTRFKPTDCRLGRHVVHDSRSLRYRFAAAHDPRLLASIQHEVHIPILDQGWVGSCTGHAGTAKMASGAFWGAAAAVMATIVNDTHRLSEWAVALYGDATRLDPWQGEYLPDDTGSDGLSVAKALKARGLIAGYQHATSLNAALTALSEGVVMVGTNWLSGMYEVDGDGHMNIGGTVEGGHEYVLDELDVNEQRVWVRNSWGEEWGLQGRGWMRWGELGDLLADDGDCTVLIPITASAPLPEPVPPKHDAEEHKLAEALAKVMDNKTVPLYLKAAASVWLKSRGYPG